MNILLSREEAPIHFGQLAHRKVAIFDGQQNFVADNGIHHHHFGTFGKMDNLEIARQLAARMDEQVCIELIYMPMLILL
jgi:hypothetical protein